MNFQLWEDLGNLCSVLKKKACTYVCERYKWDPQNHCQVNANIARQLLECGGGWRGKWLGLRNSMIIMFSRVILTLHIPRFLALSSTFSTLAPMPWQVFSWKFLGMKFHVLQLHWALLLYFFPCFLLFYLLSCEQIKVALDEVVTEGKKSLSNMMYMWMYMLIYSISWQSAIHPPSIVPRQR